MWTTAQIRLLREKAEAGMSASEIGEVMGVTRNAVIGCATRAGIKLNGKPKGGRIAAIERTPEQRAAKTEAKRKCRERYISMGLTTAGKPRVVISRPAKPPTPRENLTEPAVLTDAPRGAAAAIAALAERGCVCHWPIGDPSGEDFTFCFAPRQPFGPQPYCDFHLGRSRSRPSPLAG